MWREKGGREKGTAAAMETVDWRRKTSGEGRGGVAGGCAY
jgi:hypothetical protein